MTGHGRNSGAFTTLKFGDSIMETANKETPFDVHKLTRPAPALMTYYVLTALLTNVAIFVTLPLFWFRYLTLEYKFDEEGIAVRWGILFRRETIITYRRIQDIHLTRNLIQRWLGISTVSIQTAAASAMPEIQIEGVIEAEALRDYLYQQMRGAKGEIETEEGAETDDALVHLQAIRDHLAVLAERSGALR